MHAGLENASARKAGRNKEKNKKIGNRKFGASSHPSGVTRLIKPLVTNVIPERFAFPGRSATSSKFNALVKLEAIPNNAISNKIE